MATALESRSPRSAEGAGSDAMSAAPGGDYLLPSFARKLCFYTGLFVAYSQLASVASTFLYRYYDRYDYSYSTEPAGYWGGNFLVLTLWFPGGSIEINEQYPIWLTVSAAAVIALFGCAGLFAAAYARSRRRLIRMLLLLSSVCGIAAALVALHIQVFDGANRLRWLNLFNIDNSYAFFPMHGLLEFVGSTLLPCLAYSALVLWLLIRAVAKWVGDSNGRDLP